MNTSLQNQSLGGPKIVREFDGDSTEKQLTRRSLHQKLSFWEHAMSVSSAFILFQVITLFILLSNALLFQSGLGMTMAVILTIVSIPSYLFASFLVAHLQPLLFIVHSVILSVIAYGRLSAITSEPVSVVASLAILMLGGWAAVRFRNRHNEV